MMIVGPLPIWIQNWQFNILHKIEVYFLFTWQFNILHKIEVYYLFTEATTSTPVFR